MHSAMNMKFLNRNPFIMLLNIRFLASILFIFNLVVERGESENQFGYLVGRF